ncbi:MAG TPA: hypothetical protein VFJ43_00030 [Bacteroidia bacterium]|nr:hypothetical protein [Bacteroidia bacterium]
MRGFPFKNIIFRSNLDEAGIIKKLRENITPPTATTAGYWGERNTKTYEGEIRGNHFDIKRIIRYQNSFLPEISGVIVKNPEGTKILVKVKLHILVLILIGLVSAMAIAFLIAICFALSVWGHFQPVVLAPLGIMIFMYLMVTIAFHLECEKSKKDLKEILEAEIESE